MRLVRHFDESTGQIYVAVNELERASMDLRFEGRRVARSKLISVATGSWSRECGARCGYRGHCAVTRPSGSTCGRSRAAESPACSSLAQQDTNHDVDVGGCRRRVRRASPSLSHEVLDGAGLASQPTMSNPPCQFPSSRA